jgi:hypothetical protein
VVVAVAVAVHVNDHDHDNVNDRAKVKCFVSGGFQNGKPGRSRLPGLRHIDQD